MAKLAKVQKLFRKFGKLCPFRLALNEQQLLFACSHILKLNKAKCVHKRRLKHKPVPGRSCPSLKLRLYNSYLSQPGSSALSNVVSLIHSYHRLLVGFSRNHYASWSKLKLRSQFRRGLPPPIFPFIVSLMCIWLSLLFFFFFFPSWAK